MDTVESTAVVVTEQSPVLPAVLDFAPVMSVAEMGRMYAQFKEFVASQMEEGIDYGVIPGARKPFLWKPGAEKLAFWFGLGIEFEHKAGECTPGYTAHTYLCKLISLRSGAVKAMCEGAANSAEPRFAKTAEKQALKDLRALDNDIKKRAQKRALVGAALHATGGSGYFDSGSAQHDDEDDAANGHSAAAPETKLCTLHNTKMYRKTGQDGKSWYSHKLPDGKWCNGPRENKPDESAKPQPAAPTQAARSVPSFDNKGDQLAWIQAQVKALQWPPAKLNEYVKANWMRSGLSQMAQGEIDDFCQRLIAEGQSPIFEEDANA